MTKKKRIFKRDRDRLITKEFFALPPEDDKPTLDSIARCGHSRFDQAANTKPGDWIRTDLISKTSSPKYQEDIKRAYIEQSKLQRQNDEVTAPVYFDWRDKTKDFIGASAALAQDEICPINTRIEAECSYTFARVLHMGEELDSMLCFVQAFNADKPLHVAEEQHMDIRKEYATRHGIRCLVEPSFLTKIDAESAKLDSTAQKGKTNRKEKWKPPRRKKRTMDEILAEFAQNWRAAAEVVHKVCQGITVETAALPSHPPEHLTYFSHKLPPGLPQHIRQEIQDIEFVLQEIYTMRRIITKLRDKARNIFTVWLACDSITWTYGTEHAHESPHMVFYEHIRLWLAACYILWRRGEDKIHRYVNQNDLKGIFSDTLTKALGISNADEEFRAREWAPMMEVIKHEASSFAEMLGECKEARRKFCKEEESEPRNEQVVRLKVTPNTIELMH